MLSNKLDYVIKNKSGNIVALRLIDGVIIVTDPEQAIEACLNDIINLYVSNPGIQTEGVLLYVEKVSPGPIVNS